MQRNKYLLLIVIMLMPGFAASAQAAALFNLSGIEQSFEVVYYGGVSMPVTLPNGGVYRVPGDIKIRYLGNEVLVESGYEYAIWPGNELGPQYRRRDRGAGIF